jgi:hypothetical protein
MAVKAENFVRGSEKRAYRNHATGCDSGHGEVPLCVGYREEVP